MKKNYQKNILTMIFINEYYSLVRIVSIIALSTFCTTLPTNDLTADEKGVNKKNSITTKLAIGALIPKVKLNEKSSDLKNSIVRLSTTFQTPSFYYPWRWKDQKTKSGQGVVVGKNLVLTLASNVKNALLIEMVLNSDPLPIELKIKAINLNTNLALLEGNLPKDAEPITIPNSSAFQRAKPLKLFWKTSVGMLIEGTALLDRVDAQYLSSSHQSQTLYKASQSSHPNTGYGVAIFDTNEKFFGLAQRGGNEYDFTIISSDIISRTFDIKNGTLNKATAIPGFKTEPLTQLYFREKLGLVNNDNGCLISKVFDQGSGHKELKKGDVLLAIDGSELDAWGRYEHPNYGLIYFDHIFSEYFTDEKIPVTILRDKKKLDLKLTLSDIDDKKWLVPINQCAKKTEYLIRGGLLFLPLTRTYLSEWGGGFINKAPLSIVTTYIENRHKTKTPELQNLIILSKVLPHPSNIGIQRLGGYIISSVNGAPLKNLKQLKTLLDDTNREVIKLTLSPGNIPLWLSPKTLKSADSDIQKQYGINKLEYFKNDI